ncbi:hypothetical protein HYPSUDRAFT_209488 [Hypholoma sublateritium FD-334 SS-4]|uniref:Uncharacterized protein n=1 Tax=Hypholoma sublateritium (strain FD-334 SS-4) TaxID=945553 RepID=A0A0D2LRN8_HYPSF|nr:hypothetical protein HYPSUDRAFT_209488 [Hypholoma sublateritium FD-334 SS-4]
MLPTPGSKWGRCQLDFYNIRLEEQTLQTFYGIPSLPYDVPQLGYKTTSAIAPTYAGNEGTVNMLGIRLLDTAMLTVAPSYAGLHPDLYFHMGPEPQTAAKPDLVVYASSQKIMVVVESKRPPLQHTLLGDVMAQLVAEAIAAFTLAQTTVTYCIPTIPGHTRQYFLLRGIRLGQEARDLVLKHYVAFRGLARGIYEL